MSAGAVPGQEPGGSVRLDAADPHRPGASYVFRDSAGVVLAERVDDVVPAIRALDAARAAGLHAAGFITYEAARALEPRFATHGAPSELPLLWFGLFRTRQAARAPVCADSFEVSPFEPDVTEDAHAAGVRRILEWIAAGDTYQVNYTFRLRARFTGSEDALYAHLVHAQRAAYCAHIRLPHVSVISASPELFFRWERDVLELRPMKGTRPRGRWPGEDDALAAELLSSDKERAENLMIVDLMRNDAGRIAEFDSVSVPRLFEVERYPTVHQLTSTVTARPRTGTTLEDALRALFPSGSVTGAPKLRTSEIIAALETTPRGVYTGAIGFASPDAAVFSVAIRTLVLDHRRGTLEMGVGSGITADSDPGAEYRECLNKAAFVHRSADDFRLLESLRHEAASGFFLLDAHLSRMAASARYFGFRFDERRARRALDLAVHDSRHDVAKVRLLVDAAGEPEVEVQSIPSATSVLRIGLAARPVDERDAFLFHKTTRRAVYDAAAATRPDCDDVLLCNRRGALTSACTGNLVLRQNGVLLTPPVEAGLLVGTFRQYLLERGELRIAPLWPEDLARSEAVFVINSVRLWRRAVVV